MHKVIVGVLRGGEGENYEASLRSGAVVLRNAPEKYRTKDIYVDKNGMWHIDGLPREPHEVLKHVDVVWNALHSPSLSANGNASPQKIFEDFNIPFVGSNALSSAVAGTHTLSKQVFDDEGINTPESFLVDEEDDISAVCKYLFENVPLPLTVWPLRGADYASATVVKSYRDIPAALATAFKNGGKALIEKFVRGKRVAAGVIEGMRGADHYILLPAEISMASLKSGYICPAPLSDQEKQKVEELARRVHQALSLNHFSTTTVALTPKGEAYVIDVTPSPEIGEGSYMNASLAAAGITPADFIDHSLMMALR